MRDYKKNPIGVHPNSAKYTAGAALKVLNKVPLVRIPLNMQIGPGGKPCVKVGEVVQVGQPIAEALAPISVPIHSSVSGTVSRIEQQLQSNGQYAELIEIQNDGKFTPYTEIKPPLVNDKADFVAAVRAAGLVGLGGAGFPTHFKLAPPPGKKIDWLLINAMECEPFITSDDWLCREYAGEILQGIKQVLHYCAIPRAIIGLERNTPLALQALQVALAEFESQEGSELKGKIQIEVLKPTYPQGAEKVLIRSLTGRVVPSGCLPHDVGCLVMNVGTVRYIAHYLATGMPLVRRFITLDGSAVNRSGIYDVPIGARIHDLIELSGGYARVPNKVIMGGPMMGVALSDINSPIIKMNNAVLVLDSQDSSIAAETACIHCGRCSRACPMMLLPTELDRFSRERQLDKLTNYAIMDCIECGSCTYVCPAKRFIVQNIRVGKQLLREREAALKAEQARLAAATSTSATNITTTTNTSSSAASANAAAPSERS